MKARKGFTLMELLIVVLVLSTLAGIMVPRIMDFQNAAKSSKCAANLANLIKAIERYTIEKGAGSFPAELTDFSQDTDYFPHGEPLCPFGEDYDYDDATGTITEHDDTLHGI